MLGSLTAYAALGLIGIASAAASGAGTPGYTQGFEDQDYFAKLSPNGYTMSSPSGWVWGVFGSDKAVSISDEQAAVGKFSLKVIRMDKRQTNAIGVVRPAFDADVQVMAEVWVYRPDRSDFTFYMGGIDPENGKVVTVASLLAGENGKLMVRNATDARWQRSGLVCPVELWTPLRIIIDRKAKSVIFQIELGGKTEVIATRELTGPSVGLDRIIFGAAPCPPGSAIYFDEVKFSQFNP